jgi:enoyl-CoA hydratase/carnithine racemase
MPAMWARSWWVRPVKGRRAIQLARIHDPLEALEAGFLDEVVGADRVRDRAIEVATDLDPEGAHTAFLRTLGCPPPSAPKDM